MPIPNPFSSIAVANHLETLLPTIDEMAAMAVADDQPGDLGTTITLPAVYVAIVVKAYQSAVLKQQNAEMQERIDRARAKPGSPLSDQQILELSVQLAEDAVARTHESIEAANACWRAAASIAIAHLPPANVLGALDGIHAMVRADVAQAIGDGATKQ